MRIPTSPNATLPPCPKNPFTSQTSPHAGLCGMQARSTSLQTRHMSAIVTSMTPTKQYRGGGWFGFLIQASWPFSRLELYDDHLVFRVAAATKPLQWADVQYARRLRVVPLLADGVAIVPKDGQPTVMIFWSFTGASEIIEFLRSKGVDTTSPHTSAVAPYIFIAHFPWAIIAILIIALASNLPF